MVFPRVCPTEGREVFCEAVRGLRALFLPARGAPVLANAIVGLLTGVLLLRSRFSGHSLLQQCPSSPLPSPPPQIGVDDTWRGPASDSDESCLDVQCILATAAGMVAGAVLGWKAVASKASADCTSPWGRASECAPPSALLGAVRVSCVCL